MKPPSKSPRKVIPIAPVAADGSEVPGSQVESSPCTKRKRRSTRDPSAEYLPVALGDGLSHATHVLWLALAGVGPAPDGALRSGARRFYIFGLVLYPQDFIYLTGMLIISALSLFLFTAVAGRLWCGFACPQTVYTEIFMWIEHKIEGDRSARLRLDGAPLDFREDPQKFGKQVVWITVALWTGFTFVGYFTPIRELGVELLAWQGGPGRFSGCSSTDLPPMATPVSCASRCASTCAPMPASRAPCSTRTR
jgi:hypothetical protein